MKLFTRTFGQDIEKAKQVLSMNELLQIKGGGDVGGIVTKISN